MPPGYSDAWSVRCPLLLQAAVHFQPDVPQQPEARDAPARLLAARAARR